MNFNIVAIGETWKFLNVYTLLAFSLVPAHLPEKKNAYYV